MTERVAAGHMAHLIPAYIVGTLDAGERRSVLAHVADCAACRAELAAWQTIAQTTRAMYKEESPDTEGSLREVWRRIDMNGIAPRAARVGSSDGPTRIQSSTSRRRRSPINLPPVTRRYFAFLSTAALVILALAGSLTGLWLRHQHGERPEMLPAAVAPAEDTIVLKGVFDKLPTLASRVRLERVVLAPGVERPLGRYQDDGEGPLLFLVESGDLTIHTEGPIEITRAGASRSESIASGMDVVLAAGDRGFNPSGVVSRWSNEGTAPVTIIDAGVTTAGRWLMVDGYEEDALEEVNVSPPDYPFVFSVRRMTLAADETLAVDSVPGLELLRVESGALVATDAQDAGSPGIPFLLDKGRADHGNFPPGRVFRSADGAPVTLLIVTIREVNPLEVGG